MKRKFFLHRQNAPMDADHVIYRLWVGESVREQRILTKLVAWSFEVGATLRSWSEDIDYYIELESDRVFPGHGLLDFGFIQVDITAAEVLKLVEGNLWESYENSLTLPKSHIQTLMCLDRPRVKPAAGRVVPSVNLAEKRKYLSGSCKQERFIIRF